MPYIGKTTDGFGVRNRFLYLASASDTSVSGADANGATLTFTDGAYVDVYLNGVLLKAGTDYNTNTANTIAGLSALAANDEVTVIVYDVFTVGDMVSATSGGTFVGNVTHSGTVTVDDTTDSTSTTTGSIQTDGGLGVAKDLVVGDDILLKSDAAVVKFGADSDVTLTHVADTGLLLNSTMALQFNDASQSINAPSATVLDINATDEIELNATAVDLNGTLDVSGTSTLAGDVTLSRAETDGTVRLNLSNTGSNGSSEYSEIKFNSTAGSTVTSIVQHRNNSGMNIGTTTNHPVSILQNNAAKLTTSSTGVTISGTVLSDRGTASAPGYSFSDDTDTGMFNISNADLAFSVGGVNYMKLMSNGELQVNGDIATNIQVTNSKDGSASGLIRVDADATSYTGSTRAFVADYTGTAHSSAQIGFQLEGSAGVKGIIVSTGDTTCSFTASSDERLKTDITDLTDGLTTINKLRPRKFKWISEGEDAEYDHGFVAQELYEDYKSRAVHVGGDDPKQEPWSVGESKLVPMLVKALQEADAKIEALTLRVKTLEEG